NTGKRVGYGLVGKRRAAAQHLEQHAAERPDIRALVQGAAARLLWTHVGRCSEDGPLALERGGQRRRYRELRLRRPFPRLGETEVEHLHRSAGGNLDVGRLQVAMNDALLMRGLERLGNLSTNGNRILD